MHPTPNTRPSLLIRLRDPDDNVAWSQFSEIYEPLIYRLARRNGLQDADAQDVSQNVMIKVAEQVKRWDPDRRRGSFRAWLATVARHLAINTLVQRSRTARASGDSGVQAMLNELVDRPSESAEYEREYRRQAFRWAAHQIRGEFRSATWDAFWLTCVGNSTVNEVALRLGMSVGAVYVARSRCMARLRQVVSSIQDQSIELPRDSMADDWNDHHQETER